MHSSLLPCFPFQGLEIRLKFFKNVLAAASSDTLHKQYSTWNHDSTLSIKQGSLSSPLSMGVMTLR